MQKTIYKSALEGAYQGQGALHEQAVRGKQLDGLRGASDQAELRLLFLGRQESWNRGEEYREYRQVDCHVSGSP